MKTQAQKAEYNLDLIAHRAYVGRAIAIGLSDDGHQERVRRKSQSEGRNR